MNGVSQGVNTASEALTNAGNNISAMLQRVGLLHLQDQSSKAILGAYEQSGWGKDPMIAPLLKAAKNGPLGTATAVQGVIQNYTSMAQQIRMLQAKRGIEGGGFVNPGASYGPGSSGNGGNGGNNAYDLSTPPPNPNPTTIDVSGAQNNNQ